MMNNSGLKPVGWAVLIKPYTPEIKKGVIELPQSVLDRQRTLDLRGIVIDIGPAAWKNEDAPRAKVGDKVLISQFAGTMMVGPLDNDQYRIINANDIFAVITDEGNENG